jgi:hypothetical protein
MLLAVLSVGLWLLTVHDAVFSKMGLLGLVTILRWPYFLGLFLVVVGLANELVRTRMRTFGLLIFTVLLILYLFGTACAVEPVAALADSYRHSGILEYFLQHGRALPHYEADFSWPGAFSLGAVFAGFAGQFNSLGFTRYFPLFIELMYLAPLLVIARSVGVGRRAGWLGIALFYATDWIYQDYFSPQALGYLFLLITLAGVTALWRPKTRPKPPLSGLWRTIRYRWVRSRSTFRLDRLEGRDTVATFGTTQTAVVFVVLGLITFAMSISHELTPYALILMLLGCLFTRRLGRPELVVLSALFVVGWLSLGATDYWIGHLDYIFSGFGDIGSTLSANVSNRVSGSHVHQIAAELRILEIGGLYFLAGIGTLRRSTDSRTVEIVAAAPFFILTISSYVGEGLLRVVLYALPFTALLAASAVFPQVSGAVRSIVPNFRARRYGRVGLWSLVMVVLLSSALATTVSRGGNDAYESFSLGELDAANYVFRHIHYNDTVGLISPYIPFNQFDVGEINWDSLSTDGGPSVRNLEYGLLSVHPRFIILSQSQENWGEIVGGFSKGWENSVFVFLLNRGFHVAASWTTATVLEVNKAT